MAPHPGVGQVDRIAAGCEKSIHMCVSLMEPTLQPVTTEWKGVRWALTPCHPWCPEDTFIINAKTPVRI